MENHVISWEILQFFRENGKLNRDVGESHVWIYRSK